MWTNYYKRVQREERIAAIKEFTWGVIIMGGLLGTLILFAQLGD